MPGKFSTQEICQTAAGRGERDRSGSRGALAGFRIEHFVVYFVKDGELFDLLNTVRSHMAFLHGLRPYLRIGGLPK